MRSRSTFVASICFAAAAWGAWAQEQTTPPATTPSSTPTDQTTQSPAPPAQAAPPYKFQWKGIQMTGTVDAYYGVNFNHPADDRNELRNFDLFGNAPNLSYARLSFSKGPEPVGFQLDIGAGPLLNWFHSFDPNRDFHEINHHLLQAYVSFKPKSWHGLEIDAGKFYTSAGAEVTDTALNWNYSRSLLFALGPYYHVGVRSTFPVGKHFTAGVQLVNGWNDLVDNNTGKTLGLTGSVSVGKVTWGNNYYAGPEHTDTNSGWRHFYDSALTVNATKQATFYVNFDIGTDRPAVAGPAALFYGIAGAMRYSIGSRFAFAPRVEWYNDRDGWATGTPQKLKEYTLTGEFKILEGLLARLEWRQDFSNTPFFHRGNDELVKTQPTLTLGIIAFFGPKQ